jgi:hypothetical protein
MEGSAMTALLISMTLAVAAPVPKDDEELQKKADAARTKAVKYLKEKQSKDGDWEGELLGALVSMKGGTTALATLALLEAGVATNDPAVAKAVEYLLTLKSDKTYVVSLHTQVLARVDAKKYAKEIQANADWFMEKAITKNGKLEGWSYPANQIADNSNTHFAVMGLHAAAQAGAKVDAEIWQKIRDYYTVTQQRNGGWTYHNAGDTQTTSSMTTVALLALAIAVKYDKQAKGPDRAFEKGMAALLDGAGFGGGKSAAYELFTTAELGRALGTTEFKSGKMAKAWYREGVEKMVKAQQEDGSLKYGNADVRGGLDGGQPVYATACGLYFLGPPAKK